MSNLIGNSTFQIRLTRRMQETHTTTAQLAKRMRVDPGLINKWRSGADVPDMRTLSRLARALSTTEERLLGEDRPHLPPEETTQSERDPLAAEKDIFKGMLPHEAAVKHGYASAKELFSSLAHNVKTQRLTEAEARCFKERFADRLSGLCVSVRQLSDMIGLADTTVNKWTSTDKAPLRCIIPRIAEALQCSEEALLGYTKPPKQPETMPIPETKTEVAQAAESVSVPKDAVAGLAIRKHYRAEASGQFGSYLYDGARFTVAFRDASRPMTPEELLAMGEEIQRAAVEMVI